LLWRFRRGDALIQINAAPPAAGVAFPRTSLGATPMTGAEEAYLIMVVAAVALFVTTLAWVSWHNS
jgi:hypothetical protein